MDPYVHLPEHNAIIRDKCNYAVLATASAIWTHLRNTDKYKVSIEERCGGCRLRRRSTSGGGGGSRSCRRRRRSCCGGGGGGGARGGRDTSNCC